MFTYIRKEYACHELLAFNIIMKGGNVLRDTKYTGKVLMVEDFA